MPVEYIVIIHESDIVPVSDIQAGILRFGNSAIFLVDYFDS
ncbi:hypothetical protein B217_00569 [Bifidobacterium bifidum IPLA 20015]|nr:hypothetical protein B217_00569 [Bifidobacterium bifidum IPLA 20015]